MNEKTIQLTITISSYWHAGSGMGRGADADALVLKDRNGLPYLPGRTVKGLLREGMQSCEDAGLLAPGRTREFFGTATEEGSPTPSRPAILFVQDAHMQEAERKWLSSPQGAPFRNALYDTIASTSLDPQGMAKDQTLRTIELCVPLELTAQISGPSGDWDQDLEKACALVRCLGSHRNRGLGRCRMTLSNRGASHV